ncbi:hypothetical protein FJT64_009698 [Amphibalanus amphitrite]|uniref:Mab-21-like HhH/H2TH-like domain-containing protein n=1 Tax=Amphibalanus amphitrite TaxID=1232801 RepID=A0A6A4VLS7_AMPAM|nr:hypothetical protein FJT64_009698 [Amphibalanus amphitrite]
MTPFFEEFRTRPRVTDFPPAEAREDICRFGVHLVPTGHPGSPTEHIELRLSFSRAEVVAAWHLFPTVRIAIHGLKNVRNEMKKRRKKTAVKETKKHLKSYHIKTTALWLCQDVPRESWTSATTAMYMILDRLEEAVGERTLHCFFWTEINLFEEFSAEDMDAMRLQIQKIRKILLTGLMGWFDKCFDLQSWADRDMSSIEGICQQSPEDRAMLAAPDDLVGNARLEAHGGDVYTWDVAPLLGLLNDSDMQVPLGEPEAVASWWRQQLRLPRAERPQGMTADLDTPQGRKELLLNSNLLLRALEETGVLSSTSHQLWRRGIERMLSGSELRTKYDAITGALPDRWQLRQYVFDDC